jgi:hypothetical protein
MQPEREETKDQEPDQQNPGSQPEGTVDPDSEIRSHCFEPNQLD